MEHHRIDILNRIINKGGMYAGAATLCLSNESRGNDFISECFMQCHNTSTLRFWGVELVLEIISYRLRYLRMLYEECMMAQANIMAGTFR
jgi:hypothetical protein